MNITEDGVKKVSLILLITILAVLAYIIIKPILISILSGLLLAYIFQPIYKKVISKVKSKNVSAALVSIIVLLIILVPLWFIVPPMAQQVFGIFQSAQTFDTQEIIRIVLPTAGEDVVAQMGAGVTNTLGKLSTLIIGYLVDIFLNFPIITLHLFLVAFIFFFTLRDQDRLKEFASGLSPLNKTQEKILIKQFTDITQSIVYGQIIIGLLQGVLAGVGLLIFGVPNALFFTIVAIILGVIPVIGPALLYLPVTGYLLMNANPVVAILYLVYNIFIVSTMENILRAHFVSRRTELSQVVALVGMIGGLLVFGALGLIIGPLVLAYFLSFLEAYRSKTLSSMFN